MLRWMRMGVIVGALALGGCKDAEPEAPKPMASFRADKISAAELAGVVGDPAFAGTTQLDVTRCPVGDEG